jgi:TRAP-type mannitol/chloroaromatic compound transport system permease small subunit
MSALVLFVRAVDALSGGMGRVLAWGLIAAVLVCFLNVVLRYGFGIAFIWMQDVYVWLNGIGFTLAAAFTLRADAHVRVDLFYRTADPHTKAKVEILGVFVFLLPMLAVIWVYAWPAVRLAWMFGEGSQNIGGLPGLYLLKSCLLGFCATLALQGLAQAAKAALLLAGRTEFAPHLTAATGSP